MVKYSFRKKLTIVLGSLILSAIPLIILTNSLKIIKEREKDWYGGDYDPSYAYLYNSLNVATFRLVGHFDHPGTPMQLTGAAIIWGTRLFSGNHNLTLTEDVLTNPEHYLRVLNISVAVLTNLVLLLLAVFVLKQTGRLLIALLFQLTPFISGIILYNGFTRTSQESMLFMASLMFAALCLCWLFQTDNRERKQLLLFGIISGFGLASKIIFAPLMIIPLLLYKLRQDKKKYIKYTIISFILFTLPVIPLYPRMGWWIIKLFIHSGIYGTGSATVIEPTDYMHSLGSLIISEPAYLISYLIIFIVTVTLLLKKWRAGKTWNKALALSGAILITQTLGFLITAKHPKLSYLATYESLSFIGIIILISMLKPVFTSKITKSIVFTLILVPCSYFLINRSITSANSLYSSANNKDYEEAWSKAEMSGDAIIGINPGPSPVAAAYFANTYSWNHYGKILNRLYPKYYIFDTYKNRLTTFDGKWINLDFIKVTNGSNITIVGTDMNQIKSLIKSDAQFEVISNVPGKVQVGLLHYN